MLDILRTKLIQAKPIKRIRTDLIGLDNITGGGFVPGSVTLLESKDPGSGCTTLLLQAFRKTKKKVLFITSEQTQAELANQTRFPGIASPSLTISHETDIDSIVALAHDYKPSVLIVDTINFVRVDDLKLNSLKALQIAIRLLTQYSKEQAISTILFLRKMPKRNYATIEHMVDTVLEFNKDRVLRCPRKNRFGRTPEEMYFLMTNHGLIESSPCDRVRHAA